MVRLLAVAVVVTLLPYAARAGDWPRWGGPSGHNAAHETGLPTEFSLDSGERVLWSAPIGNVAFGTPSVADGRIYIGTNINAVKEDARFDGLRGGVLLCLDAETGARLWQLVSPERFEGYPERAHMIQQQWGICSAPYVDGDRIYIVTNGDDLLCLDRAGMADGNNGTYQDEAQFMAGEDRAPVELRADDADILWRYDIPRELGVAPHDVGSCAPLVYEDLVYTSTSNGIGTGSPVYALVRDAPAFIAVDAGSGRLAATEASGISDRLFHAQWSSPSVGMVEGKPLVFVGGADGYCYAYAPHRAEDGTALREVWRFNCNPPHYTHDADGKEIYYYRGDLRVYRGKKSAGEDTVGFNNGDGSFVGPSEILATPVYYKNHVIVATGRDPLHGDGRGVLHRIDARGTGDVSNSAGRWRYEFIGRTMATVAIHDDLVYVADLGGRLHCLDVARGLRLWVHDTGEECWSGPLVADGKVYLNTTRALWVLEAGVNKRVLFRHRGGSETMPVAANGVLYTVHRGRLYAVK